MVNLLRHHHLLWLHLNLLSPHLQFGPGSFPPVGVIQKLPRHKMPNLIGLPQHPHRMCLGNLKHFFHWFFFLICSFVTFLLSTSNFSLSQIELYWGQEMALITIYIFTFLCTREINTYQGLNSLLMNLFISGGESACSLSKIVVGGYFIRGGGRLSFNLKK